MAESLAQLANEARDVIGKSKLIMRRKGLRDLEFALHRHKLSIIHAKQLPDEERKFVENQAIKLVIKRVKLLIEAFKEEKE